MADTWLLKRRSSGLVEFTYQGKGLSTTPGNYPFKKVSVQLGVDGSPVRGGTIAQWYKSDSQMLVTNPTHHTGELLYGGWSVIPLSPGVHTIEVRYYAQPGTNGMVRDRTLWARAVD